MIAQSFEIQVALLGYVSVGKTTVLNALLQDKFSEMSKRRTTAGVNFFRCVAQDGAKPKATTTANNKTTRGADDMQWTPLADASVTTANSTLKEITHDNKKLRAEKVVQEKKFNIELPNPLCEMRRDTTLVVVDVPGLNEADSKKMYLDYVTQKWDSFDCVIIVMDADQGVNTEEQVHLLEFVKTQLDKIKNIPVIVLVNKVDDPDDDELMELVGEVQTKVEDIFKVGDRIESLKQVLAACGQGKRSSNAPSPVYPIFIPLSAGNAYAYRIASSRSLEEFKLLDSKLIDKLGRDEVGKFKWKKLSQNEKFEVTYSALSDATQYKEHLEATNFDKLLSAIAYSIGGHDVQRVFLSAQINISLRKLSTEYPIADQLRSIYDRCKAIDRDPKHLKGEFWKAFDNTRKDIVVKLTNAVDARVLASTMDQLIAYSEFVREVGWNEEQAKIAGQMVAVVSQQIAVVLEKESEWNISGAALARRSDVYNHYGYDPSTSFPWDWAQRENGWYNTRTHQTIVGTENPSKVIVSWKTLTYHDWATIFGSLLLMASNQHVSERFGREKMLLERRLQYHTFYSNCLTSGETTEECNALANIPKFSKGRYVNGAFVPDDPIKYSVVAQIVAPELISNPAHWGHVIWKYCKFMDKVESSMA